MHFSTTFSLSQTTRGSRWSTPNVLLWHALRSSKMLLHSILAVSTLDLTIRFSSFRHLRKAALMYYDLGTQELIRVLQSDTCSDQLGVLGTFYCIYTFMSQQQIINPTRIDRLSREITGHIMKPDIRTTLLRPETYTQSLHDPTIASSLGEQCLKARLIMWLLKVDAYCSFFGCKASLVNYFKASPDYLNAIQGQIRLALQLNWGADYPHDQTTRDMESCLPVNMLTELFFILSQISGISNLAAHEKDAETSRVNFRLEALEVVVPLTHDIS